MVYLTAVLTMVYLRLFTVGAHEARHTLALVIGTLPPIHALYIALGVLGYAEEGVGILDF